MSRRLFLLFVLSAAALSVVWARVFWLQAVTRGHWVAEADSSRRREWDVLGERGRILDADGAVLATDRAAVRLVFVPGEWASRERFRCPECGTVAFRPSPRWYGGGDRAAVAPRRCSCGTPGSKMERLAAEDLSPLEDALGLPSGTLAAAAADRMRDVMEEIEAEIVEGVLVLQPGTVRSERRRLAGETGRHVTIADVVERYAAELDGREFYVEDTRQQRRSDLFGRPIPLTTFHTPSGACLLVRSLPAAAERLLELDRDGRYRGFRSEPFTERFYPRRGLVAQTVGVVTPFTSSDELRDFRRRFGEDAVLPDTRVGRLGIERFYDDPLRGGIGHVRAERDDDGNFTVRTVVTPARRGGDVQLFASAAAVEKAHEALVSVATQDGFAGEGPASGGFVLLDARSGAVLAWAETPMFDPNESLDEVTTRIESDEQADEAAALSRLASATADDEKSKPKPPLTFSRCFRVAAEPGSSMKVVTVTTLLSSGHGVPEEYECSGPVHAPGFPKCHRHGAVGPEGVLEVSCNGWCSHCASEPSWRPLHTRLFPEWAHRFGLGERTGIDFPLEGAGSYPAPMTGPLLVQVSIGQSMLATPVQMARVAAAIANGDEMPVPRIARTVAGLPTAMRATPVGIDPIVLARVRNGMRACVDGEHGTARGKFRVPGLEGVTVYGKTGTANVTGRHDWAVQRDAEETPWHLWFVGYAEKPGERTVAFAMVLHDRKAGLGGDEAAPAVAKILAWWFSERSAKSEASAPAEGSRATTARADAATASDSALVERRTARGRRPSRGRAARRARRRGAVAVTLSDRLRKAPWSLPVLGAILSSIGIATITTASVGHRVDYSWLQVKWAILGLTGALLVLAVPYRRIVTAWPVLYGFALAALVLVLYKGTGQSAGRWIGLGPFRVQPSEFVKVVLVVALASMLRYSDDHRRLRGFKKPLLVTMVPFLLVVRQPDLGTAILLVPILFAMLFAAGAKPRHLLLVGGIGLALAGSVAFVPGVLKDYQRSRLLAFFVEHTDAHAASALSKSQSHQLLQGEIAEALGGWFGASEDEGGAAEASRDVPERHSDFVFAVFAAKNGFLGVTVLLLLYMAFLGSLLSTARRVHEPSGAFLIVGIFALFSTQIVVNLGMTVGLLPVVGVPLPFLSYGGSSLLASWLALGLVVNAGAESPLEFGRLNYATG